MSQTTSNPTNDDQIEFWNGKAGEEWAERNDQMDRMLAPFRDAAIAAAKPRPGERVLDIGCGCADTSLSLAKEVGPDGQVLGVDVSGPMLALAQHKAEAAQLSNCLSFEEADASAYGFDEGAFDLLFSRFGVMFFADPPGAFANMRKALKPSGRVAFICWAPVFDNDWVMVPLAAALQHIPAPEPAAPHAPGPFGLSDKVYVEEMLEIAGFSNIAIEPFEIMMRVGAGVEKDKIADFFMEMGPVSRALTNSDEALSDTVRAAIQAAVEPHYADGAVNLKGSCWIVTANNA
ncbi:MAG: methyltransferase domain-containing protein [Alphaproteobacteria bacterium]|nr:MAG: methyltransferase domain-containing protein [Alphaproteobacteria bacterium]